jgi:hypothetical protein
LPLSGLGGGRDARDGGFGAGLRGDGGVRGRFTA